MHNAKKETISFSHCTKDFSLRNTILGLFEGAFHLGRIHLVHLRIRKYFMDDSSVNFHDKFFLHFLVNFSKK